MDDVKNRLYLYDQHAGRLYRLVLLMLRDKKEAEELIFQLFTQTPITQRRIANSQWGNILATDCMKRCIERLRELTGEKLPLSPLHGGKLSIALDDLPDGARALSVLIHYAHVETEQVAEWIQVTNEEIISTLYAIEETLGASPGELSAAWRSQVVLYRPPALLRERIHEHRPIRKRRLAPRWAAAAIAVFTLSFLVFNTPIQAGLRAPSPTSTAPPNKPIPSPTPMPTVYVKVLDAPLPQMSNAESSLTPDATPSPEPVWEEAPELFHAFPIVP